jgi:hypothetical protein
MTEHFSTKTINVTLANGETIEAEVSVTIWADGDTMDDFDIAAIVGDDGAEFVAEDVEDVEDVKDAVAEELVGEWGWAAA